MIRSKHISHLFSIRILCNLDPLMFMDDTLSKCLFLIVHPSRNINKSFIMRLTFIQSQNNIPDRNLLLKSDNNLAIIILFNSDKFKLIDWLLLEYRVTSSNSCILLIHSLDLIIVIFTIVICLQYEVG